MTKAIITWAKFDKVFIRFYLRLLIMMLILTVGAEVVIYFHCREILTALKAIPFVPALTIPVALPVTILCVLAEKYLCPRLVRH